MNLAIVTGASRGLGEAIAKDFLEKDFALFTVSRRENEQLKEQAQSKELPYHSFSCDLTSPEQQLELLKSMVDKMSELMELEHIYVVNNAGVVEPIAAVGGMDPKELQKLININVLAPMVITNYFVEKFPEQKLTIVNVTSGAANRATHGWSAYGSSKAALNLFTETAAFETQTSDAPHTFIAYSPGIMDTEMQGVIRGTEQQSFKDVQRFKDYKEQGMLRKPEVVSQALTNLLFSGAIENGRIYNVNELLEGKK